MGKKVYFSTYTDVHGKEFTKISYDTGIGKQAAFNLDFNGKMMALALTNECEKLAQEMDPETVVCSGKPIYNEGEAIQLFPFGAYIRENKSTYLIGLEGMSSEVVLSAYNLGYDVIGEDSKSNEAIFRILFNNTKNNSYAKRKVR